MYKLGIDVNTTDKAEWDRAYDELLAQRPLVYSYVMDEIFNMMESGEAAVGAYYAGDYFTMKDAQADNVDLQFYYPEKTNFYVDAMCIPTCAQNKGAGEIFINYMLSEDAGVANAEYTYYASPNSLVYNNADYIDEMGEEAMAILYPELGSFSEQYNQLAYRNLDAEMLDYVNTPLGKREDQLRSSIQEADHLGSPFLFHRQKDSFAAGAKRVFLRMKFTRLRPLRLRPRHFLPLICFS